MDLHTLLKFFAAAAATPNRNFGFQNQSGTSKGQLALLMCRFDMNVAVKIGTTFFRFRRGTGEYKENQEPSRLFAYILHKLCADNFLYMQKSALSRKTVFRTAFFFLYYMIQYLQHIRRYSPALSVRRSAALFVLRLLKKFFPCFKNPVQKAAKRLVNG